MQPVIDGGIGILVILQNGLCGGRIFLRSSLYHICGLCRFLGGGLLLRFQIGKILLRLLYGFG